ncbi:MAG: transglutaminase domain-containing protein [Clostridiales bacterium]|nr:transglutaminase domain-containing protein [Clostridiales bacterium]
MAEREEKRLSPLTPLGDVLLLLCAMVGLAVSFLTLYGDPDALRSANTALGQSATALDRCAAQMGDFALAAGVCALLSLAVWSLPRFRGAAAGALAALWGAAVLAKWEDALQGAGLTVRAVTELFSRWVSWGWVFEYDPGLTRLEEGEAVRLFLLLALAGLALALGWAVVRARRWWIVALLTLPPLLPGLLADLFPSWPAFMALCACWCAMLLTDLCKWAAPDRRGALTLAALPAVGLLLWGLTLLLPREGYTRPGWALWAEGRLYAAGDSLTEFFSRWDGPFQSGVTYVGSAQAADLAGAGPLSYTGRTMLRVTSDYDGRLYLWGSALGRYENGRWTELGQGVYQEYLDALEGAGLDDAPSPLLFPTTADRRSNIKIQGWQEASVFTVGRRYTATVERVRVSGVYAPYQLLEQDWAEAGVTPVRDSYLIQPAGGPSYTVAFEPPLSGQIEYESNSPAERYYRGYVYQHYLDVPEELEGTLRQLLKEGLQEMYSQMVTSWKPSIDDFFGDPVYATNLTALALDRLCEYDPDVPAAPSGTDPVEYFLTESRRGYCMHFASAAVLMLREMGIPARYVSGYTAQAQPGQKVDVPDYNAHAWVEVYVDDCGWHPVEVTPAAAFTWYEQGEAEPSPTPSLDVPESEEPTPAPTPTPPPSQGPDVSEAPSAALPGDGEDGPQGGIDFTPFIRIGKRLAAIAGVFALLWLGQYLPKRNRSQKLAGPDRNRAALDGYGYLRRMERWGGELHPRALELAQKAKFSQHTLTPEELDEMRAFVDKERERLCACPSVWKRLAARYLWGKPGMGKKAGKSPENRG